MRILVTVLLLAACVKGDLATLEGRVVQGKDMICPGAVVTLVALDTKAEVMVRVTASDDQGMYRFAKVAPGQYQLVADLEPSPAWARTLAKKWHQEKWYQDMSRELLKALSAEQLREMGKHDRVHVNAGAVVRHDIKLPVRVRRGRR